MSDLAQRLAGIPRLDIIGPPTPLEHLPRLSDFLARDIFIKRDDFTPLGLGGNKLPSWSIWPPMPCARAPTHC